MGGLLIAQLYVPADPFNLLFTEKNMFLNDDRPGTFIFRPMFNSTKSKSIWELKIRSEFFYNSNAPNLENMSDRWIGKGVGHFSSINLSYVSKYFAGSAEPYFFISQNANYNEPERLAKFSRLNDNRPHTDSPYTSYGIRELQIYAKFKDIGVGYSNANMWWGSGMHSSIMMTNNTSGFGHIFLGTVGEKTYKNIGINARYIFSKFDKRSLYQPYFNAFAISLSYYSDNIYTIGVTKSSILGGTNDNVSWIEAATSVFGSGFIPESVTDDEFLENWNLDDRAAVAHFSIDIKKSMLKIFFEIGKNDIVRDINIFLVHPDNALATTLGIRKYELFNLEQMFFGIEYTNLILPRMQHRVPSGDWYERAIFDYSSYNGRRWVAHSGSDSDDFLLILGWLDDKITILPSINYERHGHRWPTSVLGSNLISDQLYDVPPETKLEFRLDLRYKYKDYNLNLYYEREIVLNLESRDKIRNGNVLWVGIERDIDNLFR